MEEPMNGDSTLMRVRSLSDLLEDSFFQGGPTDDSDTDAGENQNGGTTGQQSSIKTLYEGPRECQCCFNWVETQPEDLSPDIERLAESKKHALLIRMKKSHNSERTPLVLHSIVVQSPQLKELLGRVFRNYKGITTSLERLVFKPPFHPFFYEWETLKETVQKEQDPLTKEHGRLLRKTLQAELRDVLALSKDHSRHGVVDYANLWTIFKPGIEILSTEDGQESIYRLVNSTKRRDRHVNSIDKGDSSEEVFFALELFSVDYDGSGFGYKRTLVGIPYFEGTVVVTDLSAYPAHLHPRISELRQKLHMRGEKFRDLQAHGVHYRCYKGTAEFPKQDCRYGPWDGPLSSTDFMQPQVDGRIVVDPEGYSDYNPSQFKRLRPLHSDTINHEWDVSDQTHRGRGSPIFDLDCGDQIQTHHDLPHLAPRPEQQMKSKHIRDDLLCLCAPKVQGFSLKLKKWASFFVDQIQDIKWNESAFESLVLPSDHKRLMLSFVESHIHSKGHFDDVIEGKGQGIVILLEGSPGVGKTLTAEALSDRLRKPLYSMSIAELGNHPADLESRLSRIFALAAKWDAVVLLDEADVFLEKRRSSSSGGSGGLDNLTRNGIVAIFLRLLEYFSGVLFMTTNRVHTMDPAFESRIHLKMEYPDLDVKARRAIWERMVGMARERGEETTIGAEELDGLARYGLNGRQIKNLVKSALLLASYEGVPLGMGHVETVLKVTEKHVVERLASGMIE